ncbi:sulfite exporter TauE/SafE family protein [Edaphocola aurantiacus]|uniref:sulfite exporter TauE/SafE family protein n=1 Tax=Edaphocola aurantiacus TaxID=2601682 RepID=UPI001C9582CD|nr:sulfite exporter TauE/SafE family protein [Edaphocola aurantiacus]
MYTAILFSALAMGFLGSFHCIGMCGPLALSLPVQHLSGWRRWMGILLYNLGRISTYAILGWLLGLISTQFSFFGWQQKISVILGSVMIGYLLYSLLSGRKKVRKAIQLPWQKNVLQALGRLYAHKKSYTLFLIGLLNGLLPCGMVYMALTAAFALGSHQQAATFMAAFGAGTLPAMAGIGYLGSMISLNLRNKIRRAGPYLAGFMGLLLVLRGLNLGIPYLSPEIREQKVSCCSPK